MPFTDSAFVHLLYVFPLNLNGKTQLFPETVLHSHDLKHLVPGEQFPDVPHGPPQTSFSAFRKIIKFWKKRNISTLYFGTYFAATTSIFGVISRLAAYWWLSTYFLCIFTW